MNNQLAKFLLAPELQNAAATSDMTLINLVVEKEKVSNHSQERPLYTVDVV